MEITRRMREGIFKFDLLLRIDPKNEDERSIPEELKPRIWKAFEEITDKVCEIFDKYEEEPVSS